MFLYTDRRVVSRALSMLVDRCTLRLNPWAPSQSLRWNGSSDALRPLSKGAAPARRPSDPVHRCGAVGLLLVWTRVPRTYLDVGMEAIAIIGWRPQTLEPEGSGVEHGRIKSQRFFGGPTRIVSGGGLSSLCAFNPHKDHGHPWTIKYGRLVIQK